MNKNTLKIKRLIALELLAIILFNTLIPTANAGVLESLFGSKKIIISNQSELYANVYLSAEGMPVSENISPASQNSIILNNNFLVANYSPVKTVKSKVIINKTSVIKELFVTMTAYSSTVDQTDSTPFTTALGTQVGDGIVAANFLPFGTKIKIPQVFGDKIFTVEDRMNKRYLERIDIWFPDRESARNFGLKTLKVQILES